MKTMRRLMVVEFDEEISDPPVYGNKWLDKNTGVYNCDGMEQTIRDVFAEAERQGNGYFGNVKVIMLVNQGESNGT